MVNDQFIDDESEESEEEERKEDLKESAGAIGTAVALNSLREKEVEDNPYLSYQHANIPNDSKFLIIPCSNYAFHHRRTYGKTITNCSLELLKPHIKIESSSEFAIC